MMDVEVSVTEENYRTYPHCSVLSDHLRSNHTEIVQEPYKNHYDNHGHKVGSTRDTLLGKKTKIK